MKGSMGGLVLAGGRSSRFGEDKAGARLGGRTLLQIALDRLAPDCAPLAVSAAEGSEAERLARAAGVAVVFDAPGARGPLAGLCAGLAWAREQGCPLLAALPCDVPMAPDRLARRLRDALPPGGGAAVARTPDGLQSLCLVARTELYEPLAALLARGEHPPVYDWLADVRASEVRFDDGEPFLNVNRPEDFEAAARAFADRA